MLIGCYTVHLHNIFIYYITADGGENSPAVLVAISPALVKDIQHLVHGTDAYLMKNKNSFM